MIFLMEKFFEKQSYLYKATLFYNEVYYFFLILGEWWYSENDYKFSAYCNSL